MDSQETVVTHYAILIGINAYAQKPLKSCVGDVHNIKRYLEGVPYPVHTEIFTATGGTEPGSSSIVEDPSLWPTHQHVISALERVTSMAKAGDFIYIHFSGHGTRYEPSRDFSNESVGDLALVLLDEENIMPEKYLKGWKLAELVKNMVDKELAVTLVLDCCFSAAVYRREDPDVRFLPYDPTIGSGLIPRHGRAPEIGGQTNRDVSMLPNWLINPDGYAILTACGPHEEAREARFDGQKHGALSYFLLKSLETVGLAKKHKDIYDVLCAKFRKSPLSQNPVLYGNKGQGFFEHPGSGSITTTVPIIEKDGTLELQAGQAQGVSDGDQFALYPLGSVELGPRSQQDPVISQVTHTRAFTSDLQRLDTTPIYAKTGWIASALVRSSLRKLPIWLDVDVPRRDEWLTALKERSLDPHVDMAGRPFWIQVISKGNNESEILDESGQKIPNIPTISQDQAGTSYICDLIEHLARYKLVKALTNNAPEDPFQQSFDVHIVSRKGIIYPGILIELEHCDMVELVVENKGDQILYLFVYEMGPSWEIESVLRGSYEVIPPRQVERGFRGRSKRKLKMTVSEELRKLGYSECEDLVKVFVTSQPTSFDLLELPKLGEQAKRPVTSGGGRVGGDNMSEGWAAFNFPIRTSLKQVHI